MADLFPAGRYRQIKVLISAGIHGNEPAGAECALRFVEAIARTPEKYKDVAFDIIPLVNPWGWTYDIRFNRAGIDINYKRNKCTEQMQRVETGGFGPKSFPAFLGPLPDDKCASFFHPEWLTIFFRNQIFQVALPEGSDGEFGRWRNFGLLWVAGVLDDPRVFFCPSQRDPDLAWDTPYNPWPPSIETCRRPDDDAIANHTESSFGRRAGMTGVPWDRIGLRTVIAGDIGRASPPPIATGSPSSSGTPDSPIGGASRIAGRTTTSGSSSSR